MTSLGLHTGFLRTMPFQMYVPLFSTYIATTIESKFTPDMLQNFEMFSEKLFAAYLCTISEPFYEDENLS